MSWQRDHNIISWCVQRRQAGADQLYTKIPFFMRTRMNSFISRTHWAKIAESCEEQTQGAKEKADEVYKQLLFLMDNYAEEESKIAANTGTNTSENSTLMVLSKCQIMRDFDDDGVKFVKEMAKLIAKEGELIYTFSVDPDQEALPFIMDNDTSETRNKYIPILTDLEKNIQLFMELINQLKRSEENMGEDLPFKLTENDLVTLGTEEWHEIEMTNVDLLKSMDVEATPLVKMVQLLDKIMAQLDQVMTQMMQEVKEWKKAETYASVKTGRHRDLSPLKDDFFKVGTFLNSLWEVMMEDTILQRLSEGLTHGDFTSCKLATFNKSLQDIEERFFQCNLVVSTQPKDVISILNDTESKKKEEKEGEEGMETKPTKKKGQNAKKVFKTKKKQGVNSTVVLMGAKAFKDLHVLEAKISILADDDLAQWKKEGGTVDLIGDNSCQVYGLSKISDPNNLEVEISWPGLVIEYSRQQANRVSEQFLRFRFKILIEVHQNKITLETMSLPFNFNTGANQQLVHIGCRMWYCHNVDMYEGSFEVPKTLHVDAVMDMLNKRIMHATSKPRPLSEEDKKFLKSKLKVNNENEVSLQNFKEKMDSTHDIDPKDQVPFCLWFLGVVNAISSQPLSKAWENGIIYGFCDMEEAERTLMNESIPGRTVLFRPSTFRMEKPSSKEATTAMIMEAKLPISSEEHGGGYEVMPIPLFVSFIKDNGFHNAVLGIKRNKQSVAKFLYGANGSNNQRMIDVLMEYGKGRRQPQHFPGYKALVKKVEELHVESEDNKNEKMEANLDTGVKKRKQEVMSRSPASQEQMTSAPTAAPYTYNEGCQSSGLMAAQEPGMLQSFSSAADLKPPQMTFDNVSGQTTLHYSDLVCVPLTISPSFSQAPILQTATMGPMSVQSSYTSSGFSSNGSPETTSNPNSPEGFYGNQTLMQPNGGFESATIPSNRVIPPNNNYPTSPAASQTITLTGNIPTVLHLATERGRGRKGGKGVGKTSVKNGNRSVQQPQQMQHACSSAQCSTASQWSEGQVNPNFSLQLQQQQNPSLEVNQELNNITQFLIDSNLPFSYWSSDTGPILNQDVMMPIQDQNQMLSDDQIQNALTNNANVSVEMVPQLSPKHLGLFTGMDLSNNNA